MKLFSATAAALFLATGALAHEVISGDFHIIHPAIPAPFGSAKSAAGYMAISNDGAEADILLGVEADFAARVMLHKTELGADGVMRMSHVPALTIPAEDTVLLEPGGYHIMLMGLTRPLEVGERLPATLVFEQAGRIPFEFMIDPADGSVDHSTMDHSGGYSPAQPAAGHSEVAKIEAALGAVIPSGDAALTIAPITVEGDAALAGWQRAGQGGRALLRRKGGVWSVSLISGESLLLPASLQSQGIGAGAATTLLQKAKAAEDALGAEAQAAFDHFTGTQIITP